MNVEAPGARGEPVALVFTDVEGSGLLWDRAPAAMRLALAVHDAALRGALATFRGYEVKTEGDAFMCAFPTAREAIGWALAVQDALDRAPWPEGAALRVRIGVHVGETWCRPDPLTGRMDYFGPVVNRAARITSAGHGGQVLASAAAWTQAGLTDVVAVDLGEHRLRGLDAPERLWQVASGPGERRFPPLRTESSRVRVTAPGTPLFGREAERAAIEALLADARLVTVTGAAGVGKSRLAHEVAWQTRLTWPGGVTWCDLAGVRGVDAVCAAVATALGLPTAGDGAGAVAAALAARGRSLLVLDNADGAPVEVVGRWAEAGGVVLATARALHGLRAERSFVVAPLAAPAPGSAPERILATPAVRLLVAKAQEASPGFVAGPEHAADLARLVGMLDGLPLAIELAAARMCLLSPAQLVARLGDPLAGLDRRGVLKAAFDASWEALGPWERVAFAHLCVFEGTFDLEAAEAVVALPPGAPSAVDIGQTLVERSLVHTTVALRAGPRFRVLASVRGFGRAALGDDRAAAEARHAAWFASRVGTADEIPDLRVAVERAWQRGDTATAARVGAAAQRALLAAGPIAEAVTLGERLLAIPDLDPALRRVMSATQAQALRALGRFDDALAVVEGALRAHPSARLYVDRANLHTARGDVAAARRDLAAADALATDERDRVRILAASCLASRAEGRLAEAAEAYAPVIAALERSGDAHELALASNTLGVLWLDLHRHAEARRCFERSIAAAARCQDRRAEALARMNLGLVETAEGRAQGARDQTQAALDLAREIGSSVYEANALGGLGLIELMAGAPDEAERQLTAALAVAQRAGLGRLEGNLYGQLALCALDRGELTTGRARLERALAKHQAHKNARWAGWTLAVTASLDAAAGRLDRAAEALAAAGAIARDLGLPWLTGVVGAAKARFELASGRPAVALAAAAVEALGDGDPAEKVLALVTLAEAELIAGQPGRARAHVDAAEAALRAHGLRRPALIVAVGSLRAALLELAR